MLYPCIFCVALLMDVFILRVLNCLLKQLAIFGVWLLFCCSML